MKPTLEVHFSDEHPKEPGLWICRRQNFISVLEIQKSDIAQDAREGNWLDGDWAARLVLTDRDKLPLTRKRIAEFLDPAIAEAHKAGQTDRVNAFQFVRQNLLGEELVLQDDADSQ